MWAEPHVEAFKRAWSRSDRCAPKLAPSGENPRTKEGGGNEASNPSNGDGHDHDGTRDNSLASLTRYPPPLTTASSTITGSSSAAILPKVQARVTELEQYVAKCDTLIGALTQVVDSTSELLQRHALTVSKTKELHGRCSSLLKTKQKLDGVVKQIIEPLEYFESLNTMCTRVGLPPDSVYFDGKMNFGGEGSSEGDSATKSISLLDLDDETRAKLAVSPDGPEIFEVLDRTSECLRFLRAHPKFRDSANYIAGFQRVENQALEMIRNSIFQKLESAASQIVAELESRGVDTSNAAVTSDPSTVGAKPFTPSKSLMDGSNTLELLPPYTWWPDIGAKLRVQLGEISRRARGDTYVTANKNTDSASDNPKHGVVDGTNAKGPSMATKISTGGSLEHKGMLLECQQFYFSQRLRILSSIIEGRLQELAAGRSAVDFTCLGFSLLSRIVTLEARFFINFFTPELIATPSLEGAKTPSAADSEAALLSETHDVMDNYSTEFSLLLDDVSSKGVFDEAMEEVANHLYELVRPLLIQMMSLDELCDFICVVNGDVMESQLNATGSNILAALRSMAARLVEDAEERLVYRAQRYISDEIEAFVPTHEDLNYPAKLEHTSSATEPKVQNTGKTPKPADESYTPALDATMSVRDLSASSDSHQATFWYPPLDKTLMCLAKIYRCVKMKIFEELAQEALLVCAERLNSGAAEILKRDRSVAPDSSTGSRLNAALFLIKHILVLREQIAPFDVDFTASQERLDFSPTTEALSSFVNSGARLSIFTDFTMQNPLLQLVTTSVPAVIRSSVNARLVLEKNLKLACEVFILDATKEAANPLVKLLNKISEADSEAYKAGDVNDTAPILVVSANEISGALGDVEKRVKTNLPGVISLLSKYVSNSDTKEVLLKPVRANIRECLIQLRGSVLLRLPGEERQSLQEDLDKVEESLQGI